MKRVVIRNYELKALFDFLNKYWNHREDSSCLVGLIMRLKKVTKEGPP